MISDNDVIYVYDNHFLDGEYKKDILKGLFDEQVMERASVLIENGDLDDDVFERAKVLEWRHVDDRG